MTAPRRRRWPWILLAVLVAIPLAAVVAARVLLDPEAIRPRLVAAVEAATGRRFTVGDLSLALSLRPTVALTDVALANIEGGSRPQMLTARRVEVQAYLLPLLSNRIEIARIEVEQPDLLLETDRAGRGNWLFQPAAQPAAPTAPSAPSAPRRPMELSLDTLKVERARITWRGATTETVEIPDLTASAPLAGPTTARGTVALRGQQVGIEATTAALAALSAGPIPFDVTLTLAGGEARLRGRLDGAAWQAEADARIPDLARLAPLLPDMPLPPLREVALSGRASGTGAALAGAENLALRIGRSDLAMLRPGLVLNRAEVTAARLDAPLTLAAEAALGGAAITAAGTVGTPALLAGTARGPLPVDLRIEAAGATATARGAIRDLRPVAGVNLALAAAIPDLAALSPLAGAPLPAIRDLRAEARLSERTPGFQGGAHLRGLAVASQPAEARGDLTLVIGERPGLTGRLDVVRLDLDAIRAAVPAPAAGPAQPGAAPAQQAAPAPARDGRVIPDIPLPVGALRGFDADLQLSIATLTAGGAPWREIAAPVKLQAGQGRVAPLRLVTPGGPLEIELAADAAAETPRLHLVARSGALDLAAIQRALGRPVGLTGRAELDADLRGAGAGLRAVAAGLGGHLGLAMLDGTVEQPLLGPVAAALRARVPLIPALPERLPYECVALRADIADGVARIGTLLVDAPAAKVAGSGTLNLGTEAIAMRLVHDVRAAGATVRVGADLGGTLAAPAYRGVQAQNLGELAGALGSRLGGDVGALLGALGRPGSAPQPLPDCATALAAARGGREGPVPQRRAEPAPAPAQPAQPAPAPAPQPGPPRNLAELLRQLPGLFGR
jgi:AsmA protein